MKKICGIYWLLVLVVVIIWLIFNYEDIDKGKEKLQQEASVTVKKEEAGPSFYTMPSELLSATVHPYFWRMDVMEAVKTSKELPVKEQKTTVIKTDEPNQVDRVEHSNATDKEEAEKIAQAEAVSTVPSDASVTVTADLDIKDHSVNTARAKTYHPYTEHFYETIDLIKAGETAFETTYLQSLAEIDVIFFESVGISQPTSETLGGPITGVIIKEEYETAVKTAISEYEEAQARYQTFIQNALYGMDLKVTDEALVDQINSYIVRNFSYAVTNETFMSAFTDTKTGQCCHYARLFSDMCRAVGISCSYIEGSAQGEPHAFNCVTIDEIPYYFDVSWNDVCGDKTKYSWLSEEELRDAHVRK